MFLSEYFQKNGRPKDGYDLVGRFNMEVDKPHAIFWLEKKLSKQKIENSDFILKEAPEAVRTYVRSWFNL